MYIVYKKCPDNFAIFVAKNLYNLSVKKINFGFVACEKSWSLSFNWKSVWLFVDSIAHCDIDIYARMTNWLITNSFSYIFSHSDLHTEYLKKYP